MAFRSIALLLFFGAVFVVWRRSVAPKHDTNEPPLAPQSIPVIGHVISILREKFEYYVRLSREYQHPIFTLALPGQKMYVVTKPDLVSKVQKMYRTISFNPIQAKFTTAVFGVSDTTRTIAFENLEREDGWGLSLDSHNALHDGLKPGEQLDNMNRAMIQEVAKALDTIEPSNNQNLTLDLYSWLNKSVTVATTNSIYGPKNPLRDQALVDAFWSFNSSMLTIAMNVMPQVIARKAIQGRDKVAKAFEQYYRSGGHLEGSYVTRIHYQAMIKNGISVEDIARYNVGVCVAALANTVPSIFWILLMLFAEPNLLHDVRKEVDAATLTHTTVEDGRVVRTLDITNLKENCPLLLSTVQETLRYYTVGTTVREVVEDTTLDGWLLKKGAMVQMPSRVLHMDPDFWGSEAKMFRPHRFMKSDKQHTRSGERSLATSFRVFGGGIHLCPGRHFATNEILALVSIFISRYDIKPSDGGPWVLPTTRNTSATAMIMEPDADVNLKLSRRKDLEGCEWEVILKASEKIFAMVAEDRDTISTQD